MKSKFLKYLIHGFVFILLTVITQIGGIIYLISIALIKKRKNQCLLKRFASFLILYSIATFLIIPNIAPFFGRKKIDDNFRIESHNFITKLCNRNYVITELHEVLTDVSLRMNKVYPGIKIIYLEANFPLFDGFPLLPHLSHHDGKKIDITFIYDKNAKVSNLKPSRSGYGVFEHPKNGEINQFDICKDRGYWQYDYAKYLTLGKTNSEITFNQKATKQLIQFFIENSKVKKIFIEPHLKNRLQLKSAKVRFHGCRAVRHDDHIHVQIN